MDYNHNILTTYEYYDKELSDYVDCNNFDFEDVKEYQDMSQIIYQSEFLGIFNINDINNDEDNHKINITIHNLYNKIKDDIVIRELLELVKNKYVARLPIIIDESNNEILQNTDIQGFIIFFSYDFFFIIHKSIRDIITTGEIQAETIDIIQKKINNMNL
jgi:hypothetical protein